MSNVERDERYIWKIIYQFYKVRNEIGVTNIVRSYGMDSDDIFQIASMAYFVSEKNYNPEPGVKFHTFVAYCIKYQLQKLARDNSNLKRKIHNEKFVRFDDPDSGCAETITFEDDSFKSVENKVTVDRFLTVLNKDERYYLNAFYFKNKTQLEIAKEYGVGQMSISRRIDRAIKKLREVATG